MNTNAPDIPTLPRNEIMPAIAAVLAPGEAVHWQTQMRPAGGSILWLLAAAAVAFWWLESNGYLTQIIGELQAKPGALYGILGVIVVLLAGPAMLRRQPWYYAITTERVLCVRGRRIAQEARPEQLRIVGVRPGKRVLWRNANHSTSNRNDGFWHLDEPEAVMQLLQSWQRQFDARALRAAKTFRENERPASNTDAPAAGSARIVNRTLAFRVDAPHAWQARVEQRYDGPLRIFGITLLPRIIRPGTPRPLDPADNAVWNCLNLRGGPSVGVDFNVKTNGTNPTVQSVVDDNWAKLLRVKTTQVEENIEIGGFRGFAVIRHLPHGGSLTGFGTVPVPVIMRQWWLQGSGLCFEIQGIAPSDSVALQETVDHIVNSLAPAQ